MLKLVNCPIADDTVIVHILAAVHEQLDNVVVVPIMLIVSQVVNAPVGGVINELLKSSTKSVFAGI